MKRLIVPVALAAVLLFTTGCGMIGNLIGGGGAAAARLWADVPPMDGAAPDTSLQLPPVARLAVQALVQGNIEFIAYTTPKSPQEVADFYTPERMQAAGWSAGTGGCQVTNDTSGGTGGGGLCTFSKTEGDREIVLAIVIARDQNATQTQIFYVRAQGAATPAP
jgi:hypothetical protein